MAIRIVIILAIVGALIVCSPKNLYAQTAGLAQATAVTDHTPAGHAPDSRANRVRAATDRAQAPSSKSRIARVLQNMPMPPGLRWLFGGQEEDSGSGDDGSGQDDGSSGGGDEDLCEFLGTCEGGSTGPILTGTQ
jgi:hypothetical protein